VATVLFWNTDGKPLAAEISQACHTHGVDILVLAESPLEAGSFLPVLNCNQEQVYTEPLNPSPRLKFFTRLPSDTFNLVADEGGVAVRHVRPPVGSDFVLIGVHLPSKVAYSEVDQIMFSTRLNQVIESSEVKVGHDRTVIVGDFNMDPFESGVIGSDGLHAVMDKRIARTKSRTVAGRRCPFFYNPMWAIMGKGSSALGTLYYSSSTPVSYFWHTFDQVLVRPSLLDVFPDEELKILTSVNGTNLLRANCRPNRQFSDHLPLLFKLEIEKGRFV